ncbi:uncharacterized protein LOC128884446 isoform X1 [Hylaeus volcanicus]|uniref:uncharacterized protein LOC128884446 isoform X1 n=1 Tax=Hylaeus volcanicus TaxID=313075 RepID=UPI0023B7B384|nr:uncharacterized protein LOC128884446 isoform X1 [Hylaeus volcanicus]
MKSVSLKLNTYIIARMLLIHLLPAFSFIITVSLNYASAVYFPPRFGTPTLKELSLYYGKNEAGKCVRFKIPKNNTGGIVTYAFLHYRKRVLCLPDIESNLDMSAEEQYRNLLLQAKRKDKKEEEKEKERIRAIKEAEETTSEWLRKMEIEERIKKSERERNRAISFAEAKRKKEEERLRNIEMLEDKKKRQKDLELRFAEAQRKRAMDEKRAIEQIRNFKGNPIQSEESKEVARARQKKEAHKKKKDLEIANAEAQKKRQKDLEIAFAKMITNVEKMMAIQSNENTSESQTTNAAEKRRLCPRIKAFYENIC